MRYREALYRMCFIWTDDPTDVEIGDAQAAAQRLQLLKAIPLLGIREEVRALAQAKTSRCSHSAA